jgi:1-acyl-sn-glycerol-3-phosphate acyltransferase
MTLSYRLGWLAFNALFRTWFRCRFHGADRVPTTGPVILAANHASFIDPPLIGSGTRRQINFLARDTLFHNPLLGAVLRSWEVVPVDRDGAGAAGLKAILDRLLKGGAILLFPEGTRTRDGRLQPARAGVGLTVLKSTCPVVPVRVFGTYEAFGRHHHFPRPRRVIVKYGEPLEFARERAEAAGCGKARLKQLYQEVADHLMTVIARLEPCDDVTRFPTPRG